MPQIITTLGKPCRNVFLVWGRARIGKTMLARTLMRHGVIIADVDDKLSSLREYDIPTFPIRSWKDWLTFEASIATTEWQQHYKTIFIDDITRLGELCLAYYIPKSKDGRAAYGNMADAMLELIHKFRQISEAKTYNVVVVCKEERVVGQMVESIELQFPGKRVTGNLDYLFDEVYYVEQAPDADGNNVPVFRTKGTPIIRAGSNFGKLREIEVADLGYILDQMATLG